jgi:hypothetical protein
MSGSEQLPRRSRHHIASTAQKGTCLLEIKGVTLHFGQRTIFNDLNLA